MKRVLALILAGGKGTRLDPLTRERAKPAVPFGAVFRIIDFPLSNCINSGLRRILVMTQYKATSLDRHINLGWRFLCRELDEFIDILPPQQRISEDWYQGTADAVYQNIYTIEKNRPDLILILAGDHIYKMDYSVMIDEHVASGADATIGCLPVPLKEGTEFGVMQVDAQQRVIQFREKPSDPDPMPDDSTRCLASMGIYVFNANFLLDQLCRDATKQDSKHDFGKNIIPSVIGSHFVRAFPFRDKNTGSTSYWRDVGTIEAYYEANMDLVSVKPELNLYDQAWPIRTYLPTDPPPKFIFADHSWNPPRVGTALDSMVSGGCIISGGKVNRSILGRNTRIEEYAEVNDSILMDYVKVGKGAKVRRAIIDKGVVIPDGETVGYDRAADLAKGYTVTESGLTVIAKVLNFAEPSPGA
jgi:glucose-1-phosphate adenylyltransferase